MTPTLTFFDRAAMPTNLLTVQEWRRLSKATYKGVSWETAARKYALQVGGSLVLLGDDTLVVFTRNDRQDKVHRSTYRPGMWKWASCYEVQAPSPRGS